MYLGWAIKHVTTESDVVRWIKAIEGDARATGIKKESGAGTLGNLYYGQDCSKSGSPADVPYVPVLSVDQKDILGSG